MNEQSNTSPNTEENEQHLEEENVRRDLEQLMTEKKSHTVNDDAVHTFAEDIEKEMKEKNTSLASIALAEQARNTEYTKIHTEEKKINTLYAVLALLCILGGFLLVGFAVRTTDQSPVTMANLTLPEPYAFFAYEDQRTLSIDGFSRAEFVNAFRETTGFIKTKGMTNIILFTEIGTPRIISASEFLGLVAENFDATALAFVSKDFMIGLHNETDADVFMVFRYTSQDEIERAFRFWEPFAIDDLGRLFDVTPPASYLTTRSFQSEFIMNKSARVVRDENGGFVFGYVFVDTQTIALSSSLPTLETLIERLLIVR